MSDVTYNNTISINIIIVYLLILTLLTNNDLDGKNKHFKTQLKCNTIVKKLFYIKTRTKLLFNE